MSKQITDDILKKIGQIKQQKAEQTKDNQNNQGNNKNSMDNFMGFNISKEGLSQFKKNKQSDNCLNVNTKTNSNENNFNELQSNIKNTNNNTKKPIGGIKASIDELMNEGFDNSKNNSNKNFI